MRLIEADALIDTMEGHVTTMSVCSTTIEARAKGEMKRTCIADVANAPTIDAIPVEWLKAHKLEYLEDWGVVPVSVGQALTMWQKEQEAR